MAKTYIFGHKNPDTDSIVSAIVLAKLEAKLGNDVEAIRIGEINKETAYILKFFNIEAPALVNTLQDGTDVILVDHNQFGQSIDGIERLNIKKVVDHHNIENFKTAAPLYYRAEPVRM